MSQPRMLVFSSPSFHRLIRISPDSNRLQSEWRLHGSSLLSVMGIHAFIFCNYLSGWILIWSVKQQRGYETNPITGRLLQMDPTDIYSDLFSLVLHFARLRVKSRPYRGQSNSSKMAHHYIPLPEGLLCLLTLSQEHGGDTSRQAVTREELEGPQPISQTIIGVFVQGRTE